MKLARRIIGTAVAGAGLVLACTSLAAADPGPAEEGEARVAKAGIRCKGSGEQWTRGTWTVWLYEGDAERGQKIVVRKLKGVDCVVSQLAWPRSASEFELK